ncbi:hypothetical protein Tco_0174335 [Tanacetum coccineum]
MSSKEAKKESTNSDFDDDETHLTDTKEEINHQKKIEEDAKAKAAKHESEVRKEELVDLIGPEVVNNLCSGSETEEGLCKELQFSLVDNSKLNVVYLLNRSLKHFVSLLEGLQGGKKIALCQKE